MTTLYLVIPCYNEEEVLPETSRRLAEKLDALEKAEKIGPESRVLLSTTAAATQPGGSSNLFPTRIPVSAA